MAISFVVSGTAVNTTDDDVAAVLPGTAAAGDVAFALVQCGAEPFDDTVTLPVYYTIHRIICSWTDEMGVNPIL